MTGRGERSIEFGNPARQAPFINLRDCLPHTIYHAYHFLMSWRLGRPLSPGEIRLEDI